MGHPSREFLVTETINLLIGQVAVSHQQGGAWAIDQVVRLSEAEADVTYVVGTHPNAYHEPQRKDDRPRIAVHIEVKQP